jgi:ABC-type sugar transport system ATPase subunit
MVVTDDPPAPSRSLAARNVTHRFGGVVALREVSFDLRAGEIHALVGENGAGKTTLVKLLTGALAMQEGILEIDGRPLRLHKPHDVQPHGIAVVHQNYHLFPELSVAENIVGIGSQVPRVGLMISRGRMREEARKVLLRCGVDIDPERRLEDLDAAERKFVEIARALRGNVRFVILDEPTAALDRRQTDLLISVMRRLRDEGAGLALVTHRLDEVLQAADRCTVLRNGEQVGVFTRGENLDADSVVMSMLGRRDARGVWLKNPKGAVLIHVSEMRLRPDIQPVELVIRSGQAIGVLGLVGSGATIVLRRISGVVKQPHARIEIGGLQRRIRSVRDALAAGIAYIPEDRRASGVFPDMTVAANLSISALDTVSKWGVVRGRWQTVLAERYRRLLDVRCQAVSQVLGTLSGGNQQKVMIGRGLASGAPVLVIEEPTQGVDIGARREIHRLLRSHMESGGAVIFLSSDLDELLDLADQIAVIRHGEMVELVDNGSDTKVSHDYLIARASGLGASTAGEVA